MTSTLRKSISLGDVALRLKGKDIDDQGDSQGGDCSGFPSAIPTKARFFEQQQAHRQSR